jgi:sugar lactone lactonase YvrE
LIDDGIPAVSGVLIPIGVAVDPAGNIYLSDFLTQRVRKVTNGIITSIAGNVNEDQGFSGDGGPALRAQLNSPSGVAADADGNVYIGDSGNIRVRRVGADGTHQHRGRQRRVSFFWEGGPATSATLYQPSSSLTMTAATPIVESDRNRVRKWRRTESSQLCRNGYSGQIGRGGPASSAQLYYPSE